MNRGETEVDIPRRDFLDWLSPINFLPQQEDISQRRHLETGKWLLVNPHFQAWESGSGKTLWCHGICVLLAFCIYTRY
jgi:hypothetical protein